MLATCNNQTFNELEHNNISVLPVVYGHSPVAFFSTAGNNSQLPVVLFLVLSLQPKCLKLEGYYIFIDVIIRALKYKLIIILKCFELPIIKTFKIFT